MNGRTTNEPVESSPGGGRRPLAVFRIVVCTLYLLLVGIALVRMLFATHRDELSGLELFMVTYPWSLLLFSCVQSHSVVGYFLVVFLGALLNVSFIRLILGGGILWFRRAKATGEGASAPDHSRD